MGSTPHAHAAATVKHPVDQAVLGIMSVFVDTFIVLNITVFVVLSADVIHFENGKAVLTGISLVQEAFSTHVLGHAGGYGFVAICLFFFAFTTILGKCTKSGRSLATSSAHMLTAKMVRKARRDQKARLLARKARRRRRVTGFTRLRPAR